MESPRQDDESYQGCVGVDMRKRKRMISNRESARRSRQRKQQHLDHLTVEINQLKIQNEQISGSIKSTTEIYLNVESENHVLRAQIDELTNRLNSLNDIISCLAGNVSPSASVSGSTPTESFDLDGFEMNMNMNNPWGFSFANCSVLPAMDAFIC